MVSNKRIEDKVLTAERRKKYNCRIDQRGLKKGLSPVPGIKKKRANGSKPQAGGLGQKAEPPKDSKRGREGVPYGTLSPLNTERDQAKKIGKKP